jgi:hypothetical protein
MLQPWVNRNGLVILYWIPAHSSRDSAPMFSDIAFEIHVLHRRSVDRRIWRVIDGTAHR